jgi:hypothetical protein
MRAPTNPADEPNIDTRSVRLARVSEAARALAAAHAAEQRSGSTTSSNLSVRANSATSYISLVPARDRLLDPDVRLASVSPLERRSSLAVVGFVGFVLSVALTAVLAKVRFPLAETWSQPALHRTIELSSLSAPVASALRAEPAISRLIVQSSHGMSGEPAPLRMAASDLTGARTAPPWSGRDPLSRRDHNGVTDLARNRTAGTSGRGHGSGTDLADARAAPIRSGRNRECRSQ